MFSGNDSSHLVIQWSISYISHTAEECVVCTQVHIVQVLYTQAYTIDNHVIELSLLVIYLTYYTSIFIYTYQMSCSIIIRFSLTGSKSCIFQLYFSTVLLSIKITSIQSQEHPSCTPKTGLITGLQDFPSKPTPSHIIYNTCLFSSL